MIVIVSLLCIIFFLIGYGMGLCGYKIELFGKDIINQEKKDIELFKNELINQERTSMKKNKIEIYKGIDGKWRIRFVSKNGRVLGHEYNRIQSALKTANIFMKDLNKSNWIILIKGAKNGKRR